MESCVRSLALSLIRTLSPDIEAKCWATTLQSGPLQGSGSAPWVRRAEMLSLAYPKLRAGSRLSCVPPAEASSRDGDHIPRMRVSVPSRLTSSCSHPVCDGPRAEADRKGGPKGEADGGRAGLRVAGGGTH